MYEFERKHNKKYHKNGFGYQGVSPVSNFEIRFGLCSIGTLAECICINCLKKYEEKVRLSKEKIDKYSEKYSYTIRELD